MEMKREIKHQLFEPGEDFSEVNVEVPMPPVKPAKSPVLLQQERHMELMKIAINSEGGVEKLEKLMLLQERWEKSNAEKTFFDAMAKFQEALPVIEKKGFASFAHKNGGGKTEYSFAKLEDIARAIKNPLSENGLSYRFEQTTEQSSSGPFITVICIVTHRDGHSESAKMSAYPDNSGQKNSIQQSASTVSYLRRYTLTGVLGITVADEDDDAGSGFYPQEQFDTHFPGWEQQIKSGVKTSSDVINYLGAKGVKLSQEQIDKINACQI